MPSTKELLPEGALQGDGGVDGRSGRLEHREELVGPSLDLEAAGVGHGHAMGGPHVVDERTEPRAELLHEGRRPLDVGHEHRDEAARELGGQDGCPLGHLELVGDEPDRHDPIPPGCVEQARPGSLPSGVVLEPDLAEPGQGVADVGLVVDREASYAS